MSTITIILAGVPVAKARPRFVRATGIAFSPAHVRKYESALRYAAQEAMAQRAPLEGPVRLEITAAFPIPETWPKWRKERARSGEEPHTSRPDADNLLKLAGDCLNEIVIRDDRQAAVIVISKTYSEKPQLTVVVEPIAVAERAGRPGKATGAPALPLLPEAL